MRARLRFVGEASLSGWRWLVELSNHVGAAAILLAVIGISAFSGWKLPHWWLGLLILAGCYAVLFAEGAYRVARDAAAARSEADLESAALLLGTELKAIRHSIELVKATRPQPAYPRGFRLPGARWDDYDEVLSQDRELYGAVGKAYVAAHHLNQCLDIREARALTSTYGVLPDEGIDDVYEFAGEALTALGIEPDPPWESAKDHAVRQVTEDIVRDLEAGPGDP